MVDDLSHLMVDDSVAAFTPYDRQISHLLPRMNVLLWLENRQLSEYPGVCSRRVSVCRKLTVVESLWLTIDESCLGVYFV